MNSVLKGETVSLTLAAAFVQKQGDACGLVTGATLTREDQGGKLASLLVPLPVTFPPKEFLRRDPQRCSPLKLGGEALLC